MESIWSENHTPKWTTVICRNKHWACVTSMRKTPYCYILLCTTMGGYTKLTTHHDLKLTILKLQENISNHALSASHDFYKYLLVVQKHCLGLRANFCICATWNSNYMILTSPGEKKKVTLIATKITLQIQTGTCVSRNISHYIFQDILHLSLLKLENIWLILHVSFS